MNPKAHQKTLIVSGLLIALATFVFTRAIANRNRTLSQKATHSNTVKFLKTLPRLEITKSPQFRDTLAKALNSHQNNLGSRQSIALQNAVASFLYAFSIGDFETYWAFRNPTDKKATPLPGKFQQIAALLNEKKRHVDPSWISEPELLLNAMWSHQLTRKGTEYAPCTDCMKGIIPDGVVVKKYKTDTAEIKISEYTPERTTNSISIATGVVTLNPSPSEIIKRQNALEITTVSIPIITSDSDIIPVSIIYYWDDTSEKFLPMHIVIESSNSIVARLMF